MRIRAGYFLGRGIFLSLKPIYAALYALLVYVRESSTMLGNRRSYSGGIVLGPGKTNNFTRNRDAQINNDT